jgi:hypothetical protein
MGSDLAKLTIGHIISDKKLIYSVLIAVTVNE